jgi:hypothetical protein
MKITVFPVLCLCLELFGYHLYAQNESPAIAPAIKTFALNPDKPGASASTVNLFTGDVALPLNLVSMPGRNGMDINVSISYTSNVQQITSTWNVEAPTGTLGLGWSMGIPKIVCDNKQTGTREDDEYYLVEGSANRLICTGKQVGYSTYETKNYLFWKIKFFPLQEKWEIIREDGTTYVYGDATSSHKAVQWIIKWDNWIGNSSQTQGQQRQGNAWNLAEVINLWGDKITYDYELAENNVGGGNSGIVNLKQTEASYIKKITNSLGRSVEFVYADKEGISAQTPSPFVEEYVEPHTEWEEPDAYQEVYERKYLSRILINKENGGLFSTIDFSYQRLYTGQLAKRLLTSIIEKNSTGNSLPGISFTYYRIGNIEGFLEKITYPTGGTVTYSYNSNGVVIGHSNRELVIYPPPPDTEAPNGYGEPKSYIGEDYVVVIWRAYRDKQPRTDKEHDGGLRPFRIQVYQWVGEWKQQIFSYGSLPTRVYLQQFSNVDVYDYKDFQVTLQKNFFAVFWNIGDNYYSTCIGYKREDKIGEWGDWSSGYYYGYGTPTLMSGTNFVATACNFFAPEPPSTITTKQAFVFTFNGDTWKYDNLTVGCSFRSYAAANNYMISYDAVKDPNKFASCTQGADKMSFYVLSEDKKWSIKTISQPVSFSTEDPVNLIASNSFAYVHIGESPRFVYRWNTTYDTFYKDDKDANNRDLFLGYAYGSSPASFKSALTIQGGSMIGLSRLLTRFDGVKWYSVIAERYGSFYSTGNDFFIRNTQLTGSDGTAKNYGRLMYFDANSRVWLNGPGIENENSVSRAGMDYFMYGNDVYYRQPNGSWIKVSTLNRALLSSNGMSGYPRFEADITSTLKLYNVKNGYALPEIDLNKRFVNYRSQDYSSQGVGDQTLVLSPYYANDSKNSPYLTLVRLVNDKVQGYQTDYPVTLITANDGVQNTYTTIAYHLPTATMDPSGTMAQYNKVTVVNGISTPPIVSGSKYLPSSVPYGYTETYFYNGLPLPELGLPDYISSKSTKWTGLPYLTKAFDTNGNPVSESKTEYRTYEREIKNGDNMKVDMGYYVRPNKITSKTDGVESITENNYNYDTGLLSGSYVSNFDSKSSMHTLSTSYTYFWEIYDRSREKNILTPVIQTSKWIYLNDIGTASYCIERAATTWKTWGANNVFAPHKSYAWRRTGDSQFDFTQYSGNDLHPPASQWKRVSVIKNIDNKGNVTELETE